MQSEQDRIYSSEDSEPKRKPSIGYGGEEKQGKTVDEYYDMKPAGMRYYPGITGGPHSMIPRHGGESMMSRNAPRPPSPHANAPEDSDLTDAMVFLNRIKDEYADSLPVYDSFLETMRDFKFGKIDADEVCKAVRILFKDKPFLIRFFDEYLPHHLRYNDRGYDSMSERNKYQPYRAPPGPPGFMAKMAMPMGRMIPQQNMHIARQMHQMPPSQTVYVHRSSQPTPSPESRPRPSTPSDAQGPKRKLANDFIHLVKKRYATRPAIYKQFVDLIQRSKGGFDKLLRDVSILLSESPDLIERFEKNFKPEHPPEPSYVAESDPLKAIKDSLAEKGVLEDFLKIINFYNQNYISSEDLIFMLDPIIKDPEQMRAFKAFIKFEDGPQPTDSKAPKIVEKIGSYIVLANPIPITASSSLSKEVLNNICYCVSTLESEEDTYVFRNKNSFEELLMRVMDERSESDLVLDRLKYLIGKLEELYADLNSDHLELDDIQMSAALVKETLKKVYEVKSNEILEAILENPRKSIPVVLKRLYKVYKTNLLKHRQHRKAWRAIVDQCYFKAYDTMGISYKTNEKSLLSLKHIQSESVNPYALEIVDEQILDFISELLFLHINNSNSVLLRKIPMEKMQNVANHVFRNLKAEELAINIDFTHYALYYYVCILYERFCELKDIKFDRITSNKMAVDINIQDEIIVENRFTDLLKRSKDLMLKDIDTDDYEEFVRQLTDCQGYKLYNLKRIVSKIERMISAVIDEGSESQNEDPVNAEYSYSLSKNGNVLRMSVIQSLPLEEQKDILKENSE